MSISLDEGEGLYGVRAAGGIIDEGSPFLDFFVSGNPLPKQSFRVVSKEGKIRGYTKKATSDWQYSVSANAALVMIGKERLHGSISLSIEFYRKNKGRVDLDNLSKGVQDAMNGIVYDDDKQVTELHLYKRFDKLNPGVRIIVRSIA